VWVGGHASGDWTRVWREGGDNVRSALLVARVVPCTSCTSNTLAGWVANIRRLPPLPTPPSHEELTDGHDMKWATRMVCGFCSSEQPVAPQCKACGKKLATSAGGFARPAQALLSRVRSAGLQGRVACRLCRLVPL
jgi:hypothetical protein